MDSEPQEGVLILREDYEQTENLGGRPRMYETPAQFDEAVNAYYETVMQTPGEPLTLSGLVLHMGFSGFQAFDNYASYDGFLESVTRAKTLIKYGYEKNVMLYKNSAAARILAAMDDRFNPAQKIDAGSHGSHEDRLAHLK